jgi:hypothetical protein
MNTTNNNPQPYLPSVEANINDVILDIPDDKQTPTSASDELKKNLLFKQ